MPRESTLGGRDDATMPDKNARSSFVVGVIIRLMITRRVFWRRERGELQRLQCVVPRLRYAKEFGLLMIARMSIKMSKLTRGAFGRTHNGKWVRCHRNFQKRSAPRRPEPRQGAVRSLVLPTGVAGAYSHLAADVIIVELHPVAGACKPFATRNEIKFFDCQFARLRNSCRPHGSSPSLFKAYGGFRSLLPISPETTRGAVMRVTFRSLRKSDDLAACAAIDPWNYGDSLPIAPIT
jgi:hypothetical protein